jgi:sugar (pentulose or hexulose) kinase
MADALGRQIVCSAVPNASLRGVALVALRQLGALEPAQVVPAPMGETVTPNSANHDRYCELLLEQQNLYRLLIGGD